MGVHSISGIVEDVPAAAQFLVSTMGLRTTGELYDGFAELDTGDLTVTLSTAGPIAMPVVGGVILHHMVEDVDAAERARGAGATDVQGPIDMDFGMRSVIVQGPGGLILDLCAPIKAGA
ncbi:VOC family protein [uncultured Friedmanniella sp.]|uniref:VOC family protein n=1 Tax=uncultured Friedmanniella sp. TaxID=335381 RepID=UPI0035CAEA84